MTATRPLPPVAPIPLPLPLPLPKEEKIDTFLSSFALLEAKRAERDAAREEAQSRREERISLAWETLLTRTDQTHTRFYELLFARWEKEQSTQSKQWELMTSAVVGRAQSEAARVVEVAQASSAAKPAEEAGDNKIIEKMLELGLEKMWKGPPPTKAASANGTAPPSSAAKANGTPPTPEKPAESAPDLAAFLVKKAISATLNKVLENPEKPGVTLPQEYVDQITAAVLLEFKPTE
jgi:hypothetical protein